MPVAQIDAHPGCEPKFQSRSTEPASLPRKSPTTLEKNPAAYRCPPGGVPRPIARQGSLQKQASGLTG